jgi:hypothetical protein
MSVWAKCQLTNHQFESFALSIQNLLNSLQNYLASTIPEMGFGTDLKRTWSGTARELRFRVCIPFVAFDWKT